MTYKNRIHHPEIMNNPGDLQLCNWNSSTKKAHSLSGNVNQPRKTLSLQLKMTQKKSQTPFGNLL